MIISFQFNINESFPDKEFGQANVSDLFYKLLQNLRTQAFQQCDSLSPVEHEIINQKCHFIKKLCWDIKCVSQTDQELFFELLVPAQYKEHFFPQGQESEVIQFIELVRDSHLQSMIYMKNKLTGSPAESQLEYHIQTDTVIFQEILNSVAIKSE